MGLISLYIHSPWEIP